MAAFLAAIYSGLDVSVGSRGALRGAWGNHKCLVEEAGAWGNHKCLALGGITECLVGLRTKDQGLRNYPLIRSMMWGRETFRITMAARSRRTLHAVTMKNARYIGGSPPISQERLVTKSDVAGLMFIRR